MDTFKVVTIVPATVTHTYYVIAKNEKEAIEKMVNNEYEDVEITTDIDNWEETVVEAVVKIDDWKFKD